MPENTDSRAEKRRAACKSAWFYTLLCAGSGGALAYLRFRYDLEGFWGTLVLLSSLLDLGLIAPIWISYQERKKEIERRTKELLVEKKKPVLMTSREEKAKEPTSSPG